MQKDIGSMVDEFITGGGASEANLVFTLKKSELEKIKGTFKPTSNEDFILFEFEAKGMITVSMNDNGVTAWAKISTTEIDLKGENYQSFYLDKGRVNKLSDVCQGQITFTVENGQMEAKVGTTDLHISLPMYDSAIDINFTETKSESKTSDEVSTLCSRCAASKGSGAFALPVMSLKNKWYFGNTQSVSIVENGFKDLELNVSPTFFDFISNLSFTKESIKFILDEETQQVVITSDNVFYKINQQPVEFDDVSGLLEEETLCSIILDTPETVQKLSILSIPLIGQDNAVFNIEASVAMGMVVEGNKLAISVKDESNRISTDTWTIKESKSIDAIGVTSLGIQSYTQTVNAMRPEDLQVEFKDSAVIFSDAGQCTILLKFI